MATNIFPQALRIAEKLLLWMSFSRAFFRPAFALSTSYVIEIFGAKAGKAKKNVVQCAGLEAKKLFCGWD